MGRGVVIKSSKWDRKFGVLCNEITLDKSHEKNIISTRPIMAREHKAGFFILHPMLTPGRRDNVEVIDISNQLFSALFSKLMDFEPQVSGISVTSLNLLSARGPIYKKDKP